VAIYPYKNIMLNHLIKSVLRKLGYDIRRYNIVSSTDAQFFAMLKHHEINLIFDVGANTGQFGMALRGSGYRGEIVSFEPLTRERNQLLEASRNDAMWAVAPQAAIGSEDGEIEIHVSANSQSSSALNMLDAHANAAPDSHYIGVEKVRLCQLDTLSRAYFKQDSSAFLKIDTQGFEDQVLNGANWTLDQVVGIQLELSLIPLYEGQRLFQELIQKVGERGFKLWSISPVFVNSQNGRLLQVDATFFKD
jgi:FkbM family methyltransferase